MLNNEILNSIISKYQEFDEVQAIGIGGSAAKKSSDEISDIDIYIFVDKEIPLDKRNKLIKKYSSIYEIGEEYFGSGDEFFVDDMNKQLDVMYINVQWIEDIFENVWFKYRASNGYTTCFLFTINIINIIFDKDGWLNRLQNKLKTPYPIELKNNIIKRNMMLLKDKPFASYYEQIEKAVKRNDYNSINHRISAFLASYFDIIFAKNELLHSGEKRLVQFAKENCKVLPKNFEEDIYNLTMGDISLKLNTASKMVENLREIL